MLYSMGKLEATAALPRVVDAHSLLNLHKSKSARAVDAADAVDGLIIIQNPTMRLAAHAYGVSVGSVARARRLPPGEREKVRQGKRPLVLPHISPVQPVAPPIVPPVIWLRNNSTRIVAEHGVDTVLTWLAANEEVAA